MSEATGPFLVELRVVAATHRDLDQLVAEGKFRQDLLYRLNVVPINVPSLRERAEDIPLLVEYFVDRYGKKSGKKFKPIDKEALKQFQAYDWPGNIRELQNVIERAVILSDGDTFFVDETWLKRKQAETAGSERRTERCATQAGERDDRSRTRRKWRPHLRVHGRRSQAENSEGDLGGEDQASGYR